MKELNYIMYKKKAAKAKEQERNICLVKGETS